MRRRAHLVSLRPTVDRPRTRKPTTRSRGGGRRREPTPAARPGTGEPPASRRSPPVSAQPPTRGPGPGPPAATRPHRERTPDGSAPMTSIRSTSDEWHRPRSPPRVSVIMLSYNQERFAADCLRSIADQTMSDIELIVIDDASIDDSVELAVAWLQDNATFPWCVLVHDQNRGICATINDALPARARDLCRHHRGRRRHGPRTLCSAGSRPG